ncbi:hypothetical protein DL764_009376 [Monosporascus ibericus]|uniref:Aminoglycoside phosphotransferase domain-containing protein n=1 Tax=Monosporascus ibericus TaxID=155417 RepID=A0A4Q4SX83_9PEZI|nr:hypothetical protein DL764_009376 [Monosporascus ibericus]
MSATLSLLDGDITYESATQTDRNVINQLAYVPASKALYQSLWEQQHAISAVVKRHLRLCHQDTCTVLPQSQWIQGSFNLCIPVQVTSGARNTKVLLRCPMPHKLPEVDEKLRCEVGTYVWMQENCRDVRIPYLYGFGFSDHHQFTHMTQRPWYIRLMHRFKRFSFKLLGYPSLSQYMEIPMSNRLPTAYMLLEYVDTDVGQILSNIWTGQRAVPVRGENLLRSLAQLMLSLARIPQPRIGSFEFRDDCTVTLTNRPLTCSMVILENNGTPRAMQRSDTYLSTESFVADMLSVHDNRFLSDPNAIYDDDDCRSQMAIRTVLRALSHHYIKKERRNGPFFLQFTDLHPSNILVDDEWNITCLIDLEWVCALPAEMMAAPYWLTGYKIDELEGQRLDEFDKVRKGFTHIFEGLERGMPVTYGLSLARLMNEMWDIKGFWFWHCIGSVNAMLYVLADHVCPSYGLHLSAETEEILSRLWCEDSEKVVKRKIAEQESYQQELRRLFGIDEIGQLSPGKGKTGSPRRSNEGQGPGGS